MPAAHEPESGVAAVDARKLSWFAIVGLAATALYAALALLFGWFGWSAVGASVAAYALAAVFSYAGHKFLTFMSPGSHASEVPRFIASTALGLGLATVLPLVLSGWLGLPNIVPIVATCTVVPVVNFVLLDRFVFRSREASRVLQR